MMPSPDRWTLIFSFLFITPVIFFMPGFVLTRTFLALPIHACFMEKMIIRVFMSIIMTIFLGYILGFCSLFSGQNIVFAVMIIIFILFILRRFKMFKGFLNFHPTLMDFAIWIVLCSSLMVLMWPSELPSQALLTAANLSRMGGFLRHDEIFYWNEIALYPPVSVFYSILQGFFGLHFSFIGNPILSSLSVLLLMIITYRMSSIWGSLTAASAILASQPHIWFSRSTESAILSQLLVLGAVYCMQVFFAEKEKAWAFALLMVTVFIYLSDPSLWGLCLMLILVFLLFRMSLLQPDLIKIMENNSLRFFWITLGAANIIVALSISINWLDVVSRPGMIFASLGLILYSWKKAQEEHASLITLLAIGPLYVLWQHPKSISGVFDMTHMVIVVIPFIAVCLGLLISYFSQFGRIARYVVILFILIQSTIPYYLNRDILWFKEYSGLMKFYDSLRRQFLANDIVFSNDVLLSSLMWKLYGRKVYFIGEGTLDTEFQKDIRNWLNDGGRALFLTQGHRARMKGFDLKLENVERFRTAALNKTDFPPQEKILEEILVRIYRATPV